MKTPTKKEFIEYLNEVGTPTDDLKSEGGRIPDNAQYGQWLQRHDPIAFCVGYREFCQEAEYRENQKAIRCT